MPRADPSPNRRLAFALIVIESPTKPFSSSFAFTQPLRFLVFTAAACFVVLTHAQLADSPDAQHVAFPDTRLKVSGLAWFDEDKPGVAPFARSIEGIVPPPVWSLAQQPSGGRIRFKTDSTKIAIASRTPTPRRCTT